jgi:MFS family permease
MSSLKPLIPLLVAAGILLGGNGLQATLIALRGAAEGFGTVTIGLMGAAYFLGFLVGCLTIARMMRAVGHIRSFSTLAAIAASGSLVLVLWPDPIVWSLIRFLTGYCFAGLFTVVEAWLNAGVTNKDRARVLGVYRVVDLGCVTGAQFLIPVFGSGGFDIFAVMSIMITLSLVPVSLADRSNPTPPEQVRLDLPRVWRISPLGVFGCLIVGITNSAFRTLSPVYAEAIGLSVTDVVTFVSVSIIGGVVMQYPLGYLSDRSDRRAILLGSSGAAVVTGLALAFFAGNSPLANFILVFLFGSFALPLYSLSAAHANDRAGQGEFVIVNAALMLFYSVGAIGGPIVASYFMSSSGPQALFWFTSAVYGVFVLIILHRMIARPAVPDSARGRFTALLRTSTMFAKLARVNQDGQSGKN